MRRNFGAIFNGFLARNITFAKRQQIIVKQIIFKYICPW